jgi:hypothetical protein
MPTGGSMTGPVLYVLPITHPSRNQPNASTKVIVHQALPRP